MPLTQNNRLAAIGTPLGDDVLCLSSLTGREELGRLFEYEVELISENHSVKFEDIIGQNVTVRLNSSRSETPRFFNGYVSRFSQEPMTHSYAVYRATLVPWFWFLTRTSDCRIWSGADKTRSVKEIITEVFHSRGFKDFDDSKLSGNYTPWDFCVQYRETDFNFVSRLMEQEGIYYYFKHEDGKHTLMLVDAMANHDSFPGYEVMNYQPQGSGTSDLEHVRDWTIKKELFTGKYVHNDFDFENPKKDLCSEPAIKKRAHSQADFEIYDYPGEYTKPADGKDWAQIRVDELQSGHELLHGGGDARGLVAGYTFELTELPREDQNRKYLIVSMAHSVQIDGYESGDDSPGEETYHGSFTVLPVTETFRPARLTPKPLIQGPQTAIVVGPKGEEIHTDPHGRVKLRFHWDRYSKADEKSSCWIRVSHAWAGKGWGAFYLPRLDQEVIVEFLEGDPDQPIITGRVYNAEAKPPYSLPDHKTKSTLKSNSTKGGQGFNEIRFEDKKGDEQIFTHAQKDMDLRVRNNLKETIYGNQEVRVGWEKDGATGGSLSTLVKLDVNTHVKGGQFEKVEKVLNQTVQGVVVEDYQVDQATKVTGTRTLNAKDIVVEAGNSISEKTGTLAIEAGQEIGIKGGAVNVESSQGISLKCGGNFVTIDASGVSINGSMVMINSGGAASPAKAATPAAAVSLELPLDALIADDGKTGKKGVVGPYVPRTRAKVSLVPIKAPPYKPPLPAIPKSLEAPACSAPPNAPPGKPCDIATLGIKCGHQNGSRQVSSDKDTVLQIVPNSEPEQKNYSAKIFDLVEVTGKMSFGRKDKVTLTVTSKDGSAGGRKQVCLKRSSNPPLDTEWISAQSRDETIEAVAIPGRIWLGGIDPEEYTAYGRGCNDENFQQLAIWVFPSEQYEVEIAVSGFKEHFDKLNEVLAAFNTATFGAIEVTQEMTPPTGKVGLKAGWQEASDYRAYYGAEISAALDPFWGGSLKGQVSILTLAASGAGPIAMAIAKVASHNVDGYAYVQVGIGCSFKATWKGRMFYQQGWENSGSFELSAKGTVTIGIGVRANLYILQVKLEGQGSTDLTLTGELGASREGIEAAIKLSFGEIKVAVVIAFGTFEEEEKPDHATDDATSSKAEGKREWVIREKVETTLGTWSFLKSNAT